VNALEGWERALPSWGIPEAIVAAAPESPWGFPVELFRTGDRADALGPSTERAREALAGGGSVLDVGVGGGAASLPLADVASLNVGVDQSERMLEEFRSAAGSRRVATREFQGTWPEVAPLVPTVDVVLCHHVFYNVANLGPFARALDAHARRRVVVELTDRHPWSWMNDLWMRFQGLERPDGPTAADAEAALRELGFEVHREDHVPRPRGSGFERREDAVALIRRRLCLWPDRDAEVADALGDRLVERDGLWAAGPDEQGIVTLWWDTRP
jgi:SAM-dependent methyltransferase